MELVNKKKKHIRDYGWKEYGISDTRRMELKAMCQKPEYAPVVAYAAHTANEILSRHIYLSMTEKLSFDDICASVKVVEKYGMPCYCRTDFYAYRRLAYHLFDEKVKELETETQEGSEK
jgi:hypothetical protein